MNCIPSTVAQWCVNGRRILLLLLALGLGVIGAQSGAAAPGSFSATGSLATSRSSTKAVLLQSGKVLVPGGFSGLSTNPLQLPSAELYDPATGSWSMTGSLTTARSRHTVTLLPSGKVLVAGGRDSSGRLAGAEIYDAATGNWSTTGSLTIARAFHTATLIAGGKVLVTGSQGASNGEVYDPATGIWSMTSNLVTARYFHTATLLPNGKVLVAGGVDNSLNIATASAELYDPTTGNWSATGSLATARNRHTATLLPSGKVLVAGGYNDPSGLNLTSAELYDPATGSWSATGALATARQLHTATLLQNGLVLVAGGFDPITSTDFASAELYNPAAGSWSSTGSLMTARDFQAVALLPTGKVLFAGGTDSNATALASSELYGIGISYVPLSPARIWDSRVGPGPVGQSGPGSTRTIQVAGVGGVPATGASAVVINVGAINPTAQTFVTVWPTGEAQPLASNLNVPIGDVRPNLVIVK
ncbi:MAG: kelch repeat-containing protein, partial [Chthoniobacterales bacterium]